MTITVENEYNGNMPKNYKTIIERVVEAACDYVECPFETCVDVLLTDNEVIHEINLEQRQIDRPTDVLSFPMNEYAEQGNFDDMEEMGCFNPESGELMLGDIVISIDKVYAQAEEFGHSPEREIAFLVAHSMLHLFGYDHMEDGERLIMEEKQKEILNKTGYTRDFI
ncbi:MAG: rRNA maturation RNase YbeY [Lachnospiraceae bacterium]|nr:rRNA maturation RNase YbeY [Lachnospiraceae bacterium]